jgi:3-dehydroquinate synthase
MIFRSRGPSAAAHDENAMHTVTIQLPTHRYDVVIRSGLLADLGEVTRRLAPAARCGLCADDTVDALYGESTQAKLRDAGFGVSRLNFPAGEDHKHITTISALYSRCIEARLDRHSPIVALGGGVTGDMVGYVAATYLRGVPFVQVPTTLLAMVDSSVGGKVAYNVAEGKNLIGTFYHPLVTLIDPLCLGSLPRRELNAGLAECVKHGLLGNAALFDWTESQLHNILALHTDTLEQLLAHNVRLKAEIVMEDEKEAGRRALLNLGHTFGHAIEVTSGYGALLHGEAVALGCVTATFLAVQQRRCGSEVLQRLEAMLSRIGLATRATLASDEELMEAMSRDKKVANGRLRIILPTGLGSAVIDDQVPAGAVLEAWQYIRS